MKDQRIFSRDTGVRYDWNEAEKNLEEQYGI
jgi:hypothetical protein